MRTFFRVADGLAVQDCGELHVAEVQEDYLANELEAVDCPVGKWRGPCSEV